MSSDVNRFLIEKLPHSAGVYQFFDDKKRLLYIGKAKNLKNRIQTYFRKQNADVRERTLIMIRNIKSIETISTESELEALILEDMMIKKHLPPYNIKQKKYREQVYIAITCDAYPAFRIIQYSDAELFEKLFGPFKDRFAAANLIFILQQILRLRKCTSQEPKDKCLSGSIGKCMAPCLGLISEQKYQEQISIAIDFLNGNSEMISAEIDEQINSHARKMEFEEAAKWRDLQEFCRSFSIRQKFSADFCHRNMMISTKNISFLFQRGQLIKKFAGELSSKEAKKFLNSHQTTDQESIHYLSDRAYVVWVWVKKNKARYQASD
jgi:excinuclease ABC subunit C